MRFGFLWFKFGLQPYAAKHLLALLYAATATAAAYYVPGMPDIYSDAVVRTMVFCGIFFPAIYFTGVSLELNELVKKYILSLKGVIFRK